MASNRFKIIYSNSDDTKSTQYTRLQELKEKGIQTTPQEETVAATPATPKFCPHCGKEGELYSGLIPVRGLKPYTWLLCTLFIVAVWVYVWWYTQNDGATSSWLINIGLVISPIALSLCALIVMKKLSSPHHGQAVICHDCKAAYALSDAPSFSQGWDMDKFMLVLQGQDKKSRRRKAMMEKLVKKAGLSSSQVSAAKPAVASTAATTTTTATSTTPASASAAASAPATPSPAVAPAAVTEGSTTPVEAQPVRELTPEEIGIAAAREAQKPNKNSLLGRIF